MGTVQQISHLCLCNDMLTVVNSGAVHSVVYSIVSYLLQTSLESNQILLIEVSAIVALKHLTT